MKKYIVIGGQYKQRYYGESDTIKGAQQIARKHEEYWDNWQGWHVPAIYASADCIKTEEYGIVTNPDYPVVPVAAVGKDGKWMYNEEV